jgi:DNA mismatch repair protein MutL
MGGLQIDQRKVISRYGADRPINHFQTGVWMNSMTLQADVSARIRPLAASLVNKIAAGEVIERPANVVKELLENSVDALATRIDVEVEQGGSELIRITDDGEGIHPDDLPLAIASHATSKLRDADDLFRVQTMGFRGEALASIAEISRLRLRSRQPHTLEGCELSVEAGKPSEPRPCGCPVGTQVEVRQLFFNTPVRRKFLKTPATEFGHVVEHFTRVALGHPRLTMTLRHNGKSVFELPATLGLLERLAMFYGRNLADDLIEVAAAHEEVRLWGYVASPQHSKATRKGQYLFVNGRWIQDRSLQHALGEAYRGLLMTGRAPIAFLFLEVPAADVDVNVHPTKSEVRFRDTQQLYRLVLSTLRNRFLGMDFDSALSLAQRIAKPQSEVDPAYQQQVQRELVTWAKDELSLKVAEWEHDRDMGVDAAQESGDRSQESEVGSQWSVVSGQESEANAFSRDALAERSGAGQESGDRGQVSEVGGQRSEVGGQEPAVGSREGSAAGAPLRHDSGNRSDPFPVESAAAAASGGNVVHVRTGAAEERPASEAAELRAMQVHDCYLVVATGNGLTVVDQHALHERILYERLKKHVLAGDVEVQRLLVPMTIEMSAREAALLQEHRDLLAEMGLLVELFSGTTAAVSGLPTLLHRASPDALVKAVVELLEERGGRVSRQDVLEPLLQMMSCKGAIKSGQRLSAEEINALLTQRHLVNDAHHCPHGRPTALTLTRQALDRQFGRLG